MRTMNHLKKRFGKVALLLGVVMLAFSTPIYAHCDSYDGPVIQDARKALHEADVRYILKWIEEEHEGEIVALFEKTVALKSEDTEVYGTVEKHFLETLVRLHREGEGAPFTGLKPAGSATPIVKMADRSIADEDVNSLLGELSKHIQHVIAEKYEKVNGLSEVKDNSTAEGRAYVAAYVDYTHTLEAIESALAGGAHHH